MKLSAVLGHVALFAASMPSHAEARPRRALHSKRANVESTTQSGVFVSPPDGLSFTGVAAVVTAPSSVTVPPGAPDGNYYGSAWIGLDGDASGATALVQCGITWSLIGGTLSWATWYEWLPNGETGTTDGSISIQPGDQFAMTLNVDSSTQVTVAVTDTTQNEALQSYVITAPDGSSVSGNVAEWVVEDLYPSQQLQFADFGTVTFSSCSATLSDGTFMYPPSGDDWYIFDANGNQLTQVTVGDNSVAVNYFPGAGSVG
ncbi:peptidase G1 [Xylariales sp. AK1849]|nr:peptidase G1 [Xylariales sp. AK1849]